jgi:hypothetical protein
MTILERFSGECMTEETLRGCVEFDFEPQPLEQLSVERTCIVSNTCCSWVVCFFVLTNPQPRAASALCQQSSVLSPTLPVSGSPRPSSPSPIPHTPSPRASRLALTLT